MRKLLILVCAFLMIASLGMQKAEAATYVSMLATGTDAAWVKCDYDTSPDINGDYFYSYTVYIKDFSTYTLPSGYAYLPDLQALKVLNVSGSPVVEITSPTVPLKWNFAQSFDYKYYQWSVNNYNADLLFGPARGGAGELDSMKVSSKFGPTYVGAAVWDGGLPTSSGNTVGPAPEPASLSLLGLSLLGLGGMFRRKFMA